MPDPVAQAIEKGLQAMIAADPSLAPPEETRPKGFAALLKKLRPRRDE